MRGLAPRIQAQSSMQRAWMAGSSPAMTDFLRYIIVSE
jgi:hypothetical protein